MSDEWIVTVQRDGGPIIPKTFTDKPKALRHYAALKRSAGEKVKVEFYGPK